MLRCYSLWVLHVSTIQALRQILDGIKEIEASSNDSKLSAAGL